MDASKTFTYFIKAQTGDLERGFKKTGQEATSLTGKLGKLEKQSLDVREASIRVEKAQRAAASATERYGKQSLQAAAAQVRLERAQQKANEQTKIGTKHSSLLAGSLKRAAGAAVALGAGYASIRGAKDAVDTTEELGHSTLRLHRNFGLSIKSASEFAAVMKVRGVDAKQGAQAFKTLASNIVGVGNGSKGAIQTFKLLGVSQKDLKGKDFAQQLALVSDGLKALPGGAERATAASKLFGRGWQALTPLIGSGSKAMQEQLALADKYGATLGGKSVKDVERMIEAQREQKLAMLGIQVTIGKLLIPILADGTKKLTTFIGQIRDGTGAGGKFRDQVVNIWNSIKPTVKTLINFGKAVGNFAEKHPEVKKLAFQMAAVGSALKLISFGGKISGLSTFLKAARIGATKFIGYWAAAGTAAGEATGTNLASSGKKSLPGAVSSMRGSFKAAGGRLAAAVAAGMVVAIPVAFAGFLSAAGNYLKSHLDPHNNQGTGKLGGNNNNAWDIIKGLVGGGADGGAVSGGTPGRDSVLKVLMPGEHVLTTREVQAAGGHGAIFAMRRALGGGTQSTGLGMASGGVVGGAARLEDYLTGKGFTPTSTTGGKHAPNSYHYRGMALDYGNSANNIPKLANTLWPLRAQFAELFIPTSAPHGGLYHNGQRFQNARLQAQHQDHIHVADWGGFSASGAARTASSQFKDGTCTWYKPSAGGINGSEGAGAWPGHPIYDSTWGCAAPPAYAFGTLIEFQYNGRSVVVPVVDRGGAIQGTHFDLLPGPAAKLGMQKAGNVHVKFRVRGRDSKMVAQASAKAAAAKRMKHIVGLGRKQAGIRKSVNASRATRIGQGYEDRYTLATLTPSAADDYQTAVQGYAAADTLVRQYQYGLTHGDKRVTGDMLSQAITDRSTWADRRGTASDALSPGTQTYADASSGGSGVDLGQAIKDLGDQIAAQNKIAEQIRQTTGGTVIQGLIAQMASTGIGTSFNLANQAAGRGAGQHVSY